MWSQDAHNNENRHDTYFSGISFINYLFLNVIFTCDDKYRSQNIGLSSIFTIYIFGYYTSTLNLEVLSREASEKEDAPCWYEYSINSIKPWARISHPRGQDI